MIFKKSPRPDSNAFNNYSLIPTEDLILRDKLAIDRTILSNERTFLSYCRTGLALAVTGAGAIKFFPNSFFSVVGFVLIFFGVAVIIFGSLRTISMARKIKSIWQEFSDKEE